MSGLADYIIERRLKYIKNIKNKIDKELTNEPFPNFKNFMLASEIKENDPKLIISSFINNSKNHPYFQRLHETIKNKPFSWESLKEIEEIGGIKEIFHNTISGKIEEIISIIDRNFAPFLEPLKSLPKIYSSKGSIEDFGLEPNCIGACQIITSLYSLHGNDIRDLKFLEIYNSKRKDILLNKLKELRKNEEKGIEFSESNFDTFFYSFPTNNLKNMVFDQILSIEDFTHGAVKNQKTGEIYDYELEKENYKGVIEYPIEEGLFYSTFLNLLYLMKNLGRDETKIKNAFNEIYKNFDNSVLTNSVGLEFYFTDHEKSRNFLEKIKEIYNTPEELPAKYAVFEILLDFPEAIFNQQKRKVIKEKLKFLQEKYILPEALELISERYLNSNFLSQIYQTI